MKKIAFLALGLLVALTGCSDVTDFLGLGRNPPDEFSVIDRPPLAIPPDFSLRPPKPGAARPQEATPTQQASKALLGSNERLTIAIEPDGSSAGKENAAPSDVEKKLLESAGAEHANPNIRDMVDREAAQKVVSSRHLIDELLWWREDRTPAATVDAPAEAERIKEAKENGAPINQGATPVIERQKSGWLGL